LNAIDAQKIGLVNEIINDGIDGRNQLIKKITTEIALYKLVKIFSNFLCHTIGQLSYYEVI